MAQVEEKPMKRRRAKSKLAKTGQIKQLQAVAPPVLSTDARRWQLLAGVLVLAVGAWSYWPTLVKIVSVWNRQSDYSHGYLVIPAALIFLWARRASFPGFASPAYLLSLGLLGLAIVSRYLGALFYFSFVDAYSTLLWVASVVAMVAGWRTLLWALPSIGFLFFMIPLPFGIETAMSSPLQRVATKLSCWVLQLLGQPAFAEGNVILLGDHQLEVAQACSGLAIFMSIIALAYGYVVLVRRAAWEKVILVLSVAPIAIVANSARIVATGLLYEFTSSPVAHKFAHDYGGPAVGIPLAGALFALVLWYLSMLIEEVEVMEMSALVRESRL
jgi:exosortase